MTQVRRFHKQRRPKGKGKGKKGKATGATDGTDGGDGSDAYNLPYYEMEIDEIEDEFYEE